MNNEIQNENQRRCRRSRRHRCLFMNSNWSRYWMAKPFSRTWQKEHGKRKRTASSSENWRVMSQGIEGRQSDNTFEVLHVSCLMLYPKRWEYIWSHCKTIQFVCGMKFNFWFKNINPSSTTHGFHLNSLWANVLN